MTFQIAERWFETRRVDDDITLIWEPYVVPLMRCNIWHVRGRERDLLIDTGLGIVSLSEAARHLLEKALLAVATHTHLDHVGGHHEFENCLVHRLEAESLCHPPDRGGLSTTEWDPADIQGLRDAGYEVPPHLVTALPHPGYRLADYVRRSARATAAKSRCCIFPAIRRAASAYGRQRAARSFPGMRSTMVRCSTCFRAATSPPISAR